MPSALTGKIVVALEQAVAAPLATSRLADAGARVIKLERPEGDFARGYDAYVHGQASYFVWNNRGKESCIVDLRKQEDRDLVDAMLSMADVFVQNLAPGAAERLGLGAAKLRERLPRLIVCDIAGYAPGTPDQERKAYDLLIQAETGLSALTGSAESGPSRVGISICDIATGQAAYAGILEALLLRERTGQGSHLQLSLFDTMAELMNVPYLARRYGGIEPARIGLAHPSIAPYGVYSASDGEILIAVQNEREWELLCLGVLGDPALLSDARFAGNAERVRNRDALDVCIRRAFAGFAVAELTAKLDASRIAYGRVSTMADLVAHRSATTTTVRTPDGSVEMLAPAVIADGRRASPGAVPALGQHGETLRREFMPEAGRRPDPPRAGSHGGRPGTVAGSRRGI